MNNKFLIALITASLTSGAAWSQNVGISVVNPLEKLDVDGDIYVRGDQVYFSHDAATNTNNDYMGYSDVNSLPFLGTGMFYFQADVARGGTWDQPTASISARGGYFLGRLAVGTQTPQTLLHIASNRQALITLEADTDNVDEDDNARIEMYQDNRLVGAMLGFFDGTVNSGNTFRIGMRESGVTDWNTLTINTVSKHVGIGTDVPDQRLDIVGGGIQLNDTFGIGFLGEIPANSNVSGDRARFYWDGDYAGMYSDFLMIEKTDGNQVDPDGGIAFINKGSDNVRDLAMIIRGNGRVGLQTINPVYALELPNNATNGIGRARANAWVTYSDGRLKSQRKTLPYGIATVMKLRPMRYFQANSTQDETGAIQLSKEGAAQIGFIAQELEQVVPEAVSRPEEEGKDYWGVDYTRLVPVLTKAIQEQQESIQRLEDKCATLEAELKALKE
ncbi:MAG: tail fiber domain-containing protein [Aureispira sp.]